MHTAAIECNKNDCGEERIRQNEYDRLEKAYKSSLPCNPVHVRMKSLVWEDVLALSNREKINY